MQAASDREHGRNPRGEIRPLLAELARAHLVTERVPGRFTLHDLLRVYAAGLAAADDSDELPRGEAAGA